MQGVRLGAAAGEGGASSNAVDTNVAACLRTVGSCARRLLGLRLGGAGPAPPAAAPDALLRALAGGAADPPSAGGGVRGPALQNPLALQLRDVGVDDGGYWTCYTGGSDACYTASDAFVPGAGEAGVQGVPLLINVLDTSPRHLSAMAAYRYLGPVFAAVDVPVAGVDLRYSIDGSGPDCSGAADLIHRLCVSAQEGQTGILASRAVQYGGKTRLILYGDSSYLDQDLSWARAESPGGVLNTCDMLRVWVCRPAPDKLSVLNLTAALSGQSLFDLTGNPDDVGQSLGPIVPGPKVSLDLVVTSELGSLALTQLRNRLCSKLWNSSADGVAEECEWRMWVDIEAGVVNARMWSDLSPLDLHWAELGDNQPASPCWTVTVTVLAESNSYASRARALLTDEVNAPGFMQQFGVYAMTNVTKSGVGPDLTDGRQYFARVSAPSPSSKRDQSSLLGCLTHYECADGMFCSWFALQTWAPYPYSGQQIPAGSAFVGAGWGGCDVCSNCFDSDIDPLDGSCPHDKCGPLAGTYPKCIDAGLLVNAFSCQDTYTLNLTLVPSVSAAGDNSITGTGNLSSNRKGNPNPTNQSQSLGNTNPGWESKAPKLRTRFATPFNRLVGALLIRQKRLQMSIGLDGSNVCGFRNDSVLLYSNTADPTRGLICLQAKQSTDPFGSDPVFTSSSILYDGKLDVSGFYNTSEYSNPISRTPYGFFPHRYDPRTGMDKTTELFPEEADNFLLFLDERISGAHAQRMITYINDGNFLDGQTKEISVEMITLNADVRIFSSFKFIFTWMVCFMLIHV